MNYVYIVKAQDFQLKKRDTIMKSKVYLIIIK